MEEAMEVDNDDGGPSIIQITMASRRDGIGRKKGPPIKQIRMLKRMGGIGRKKGSSRKQITMASRRDGIRRMASRRDGIGRKMEVDNDGGPPSKHMETIVKYVTMTTDISLKLNRILYEMKRFIGKENYQNIYTMEVNSGMKEMIKVLQEKEPENCLQILVHVLVECECLKNTGWKDTPDPISALLLERREPIAVIERLLESVEEGDVDEVEQMLSQYPIPQDMEHITRECCVLSLEKHHLTLVEFLYKKHPKYRSMLHNENNLERFLVEAVRVDYTKVVQFLFLEDLPSEGKLFYIKLLEKAKSVDMLEILVSDGKIRKYLNDNPWFSRSILYDQILHSSTQPDCKKRVQILVNAGVRVENLVDNDKRKAWLKIIKERWFQVFNYLVKKFKDINSTNRNKQNVLHVILDRNEDKDSDVRYNILDFVRNLVERGIDVNSVDKHGQTPLMLFKRAGYDGIVKYLSERECLIQHGGADVNNVDMMEGQL